MQNTQAIVLGSACGVVVFGIVTVIGKFFFGKPLTPASMATLEKVKKVTEEMQGVNPALEVYEGNEDQAFPALFPWTKPFICLTKDANKLSICHELIHIKNNHGRKNVLIMAVALPILVCLPVIYFPLGIATILASVNKYAYYCEKEADIEGMKYVDSMDIASTTKEMYRDRKGWKTIRENSSGCYGLYLKTFISPNGDYRFFDIHPTYTERIEYFSSELAKRNDIRPLKVFIQHTPDEDPIPVIINDDENRKIRSIFLKSDDPIFLIDVQEIIIMPYSNVWECKCTNDSATLQWKIPEVFTESLNSFNFMKQ